MGGGHNHHHAPYTVPDFSIYKVEEVPRLMALKEKLAKKGLTDPWLRNEVWRFSKAFPTEGQNIRAIFSRGLGLGVVLFGLTMAYTKLTESKDDHGHH